MDPPQVVTYFSVVSRDLVRILLTIGALNHLDVQFFDIHNAYLNANTDEKVYFKTGPYFVPDIGGRAAVVLKVLYGLKSAIASFHNYLKVRLSYMRYKPCLANTETWMKPYSNQCGFNSYAYFGMCVYYGISVSYIPYHVLKGLQDTYVILKSIIKALFYK